MHSPCGIHEYPKPTKRCALCARLMAELKELPTMRPLTKEERLAHARWKSRRDRKPRERKPIYSKRSS